MVKVAIAGAAGRMGRTLVEAIARSEAEISVTVATVLPDDPALGVDIGLLAMGSATGVATVAELKSVIDDFDVLIDFTSPEATLAHLAICRAHNKAMVIGTTGLSETQQQTIAEAAEFIPIVIAPNMSVGVNLCFKLLEQAAKILGD